MRTTEWKKLFIKDGMGKVYFALNKVETAIDIMYMKNKHIWQMASYKMGFVKIVFIRTWMHGVIS